MEETCEESVTELGPVGQVVTRSEGELPLSVEGASEGKFTGQAGEDAPWPLGEGASGETPGSASLGSNVQATVSEEALVKSEAVEGSVCAPQFLNVLSEGKAAGDQQPLDEFGAELKLQLHEERYQTGGLVEVEDAQVNEGKVVLMPELPVGVPAKIHLGAGRLMGVCGEE